MAGRSTSTNAAACVDLAAGVRLDRQQFERRVESNRMLLTGAGIGPTTPVALVADTGAASIEVMVAARRNGAQVLLLDVSYPLEELAYAINVGRTAVVIADPAHAQVAAALVPLTPEVVNRFALGRSFPAHPALSLAERHGTHLSTASPSGTSHLVGGVSSRPLVHIAADPLLHPEAVAGLEVALGGRVIDQDTVLVCATSVADPLAAQLVVATLESGGSVVVPAGSGPLDVADAVAEEGGNLVHLNPISAAAVVRAAGERGWSAFRRADPLVVMSVLDGSAGPIATLAEEFGSDFRQVLVVPEIGVVSAIDGKEFRGREGSVGRPAGVQVRVVPGPRSSGQVEAEHPHDGRWVRIGQSGRLDPAGYLFLEDSHAGAPELPASLLRRLEQSLTGIAGVADVALVASRVGSRRALITYVELADGVALTRGQESALLAVGDLLPEPWRVMLEIVNELPRTAVGKLDRRRLGRRAPLPAATTA